MPSPAAPYTDAERRLLELIRVEVAACLKTTRGIAPSSAPGAGEGVYWAQKNRDYYDQENARYIPARPAEEDIDYRARPKVVSGLTRRAVDVLTDHLYSPGPSRRIEGAPDVDAWLQGVYRDNHVDCLMQEGDRFSTLNGTVAVQVAASGDPARPIVMHLWDRADFEAWASPGRPTVPFAVCTISRFDEQTTFDVYTRLDHLVYRTKKLDADLPMGGRTADFVPGESGPHGYGVLPFGFVHYQPPTQGPMAKGIGSALRHANATVDIQMSDVSEAVWLFHKPIGFFRNVDAAVRPRIRPGSFTHLPASGGTAGEDGPLPEAFYLQAQVDVAGAWTNITNIANGCFEENGVPLSAVRMEQTGVVSGLAIVAEQAPLLTRAAKRQRAAALYETGLAAVVLAVGGNHYDRPELVAAAADPKLSLTWPEPRIPIPGPDRDEEDAAELAMGITSKVEVLMRRRGMTRDQALAHIEQMAKDEAEVQKIRATHGPKPPEPPADPGGAYDEDEDGGNGPPARVPHDRITP